MANCSKWHPQSQFIFRMGVCIYAAFRSLTSCRLNASHRIPKIRRNCVSLGHAFETMFDLSTVPQWHIMFRFSYALMLVQSFFLDCIYEYSLRLLSSFSASRILIWCRSAPPTQWQPLPPLQHSFRQKCRHFWMDRQVHLLWACCPILTTCQTSILLWQWQSAFVWFLQLCWFWCACTQSYSSSGPEHTKTVSPMVVCLCIATKLMQLRYYRVRMGKTF